jgi:hypothetical protein
MVALSIKSPSSSGASESKTNTAATERQRAWAPQVNDLADAITASSTTVTPQIQAAVVQMRSAWK